MSFVQYISPTCNFLLAVFWFDEPFSIHSLIMFVLVWIGVGIYALLSVMVIRGASAKIQPAVVNQDASAT